MMIKKQGYALLSCLCLLGNNLVVAQHQTAIRYLSGTDNEHTITWDFFCTGGRNSGAWQKIAVPGHWEQQGFGAYNA